ncbi:MAG TPA: ABC transporter permease [Syntrophales bacterium]|nr:ABC transporter permease [Syntrophales bacterium]HOL60097.1 ABC transporter permease [Syntrophales bacterium]HPO35347.1 ABC transporter permease [Syntrophales bacterium]
MVKARLRELIRKELIQLFRDRRTRWILIVAPLIQLVIFGYVINFDIHKIRMAVYDLSHTRESRELVRSFTGSGIFHPTCWAKDEREVTEELLKGRSDLALIIGPDFARNVRRGASAPIQIVADGTTSNMAAIRLSYAANIVERVNTKFLEERYPVRLMNFGRVEMKLRTWYNPNLYSRHYFVPGIAAFLVMLIALIFTSLSIVREKEAGNMEQLFVTPIKRWEFITGKTLPYAAVAIIQMILVTSIGILWFDLPFPAHPHLLLLGVVLFLLTSLGIGIFISTISSTQQQAIMSAFFFLQPAFLLSGFVFPIANMPQVVQWLTLLNPFRYMLVIIRGLFLKGVGWEVLWPQYLALTAIGLTVFGASVLLFHKRLD